MSKIFQVAGNFLTNNICHWDATKQFPTLESTVGKFAPDIVFVEAPDNVFEGWGYDANAEGDARFIQPEPPEHWLYDTSTGTFTMDTDDPPAGWAYNAETGQWSEVQNGSE